MRPSKKEPLVETAADLFEKNGYHATGIDKILEASGVAKMTLYNHFKSKEDLIVAALELRDERFKTWFKDRVEALADNPRDQLLAMFDVLEEWFESDGFVGCMFLAAAGEYGDANHPIHQQAAKHKRSIYDYTVSLAKAAGALDARALAQQLLVLQEGATAVAHIMEAPIAARQAKRAARTLIDAALD